MDVSQSFRQKKSRSIRREMRFVENRLYIIREQELEGEDEY